MVSVYIIGVRGIYHEFAVYNNSDIGGWAAGYGFRGNGMMGGYGYNDDETIVGILAAFEKEDMPMIFRGDTPIGKVIP